MTVPVQCTFSRSEKLKKSVTVTLVNVRSRTAACGNAKPFLISVKEEFKSITGWNLEQKEYHLFLFGEFCVVFILKLSS